MLGKAALVRCLAAGELTTRVRAAVAVFTTLGIINWKQRVSLENSGQRNTKPRTLLVTSLLKKGLVDGSNVDDGREGGEDGQSEELHFE